MNELPLTFFDMAVLVVVILSAILSLARGGMRELLSLASWVGALAVALTTFATFRPMVMEAVNNDLIADVGTGVLVFFVPLVVFKIVGRLVANAVAESALGPLDRLFGLVFGVARGALIVCAGYLVTEQIIPREEMPEWVQNAYLVKEVQQGADFLTEYVPDDLLARSEELVTDTLDRARTPESAAPVDGTAVDGAESR